MSGFFDNKINCYIKRFGESIETFPEYRQKIRCQNYSQAELKRNQNKVTQHRFVLRRVFLRFRSGQVVKKRGVATWKKWRRNYSWEQRVQLTVWDCFGFRENDQGVVVEDGLSAFKWRHNTLRWEEEIHPTTTRLCSPKSWVNTGLNCLNYMAFT